MEWEGSRTHINISRLETVGNQNDNVAFKRRAYMSVNSEQSHGGSDS